MEDLTSTPELANEIKLPDVYRKLDQSTLNATVLMFVQEWSFQNNISKEAMTVIQKLTVDNYNLLKDVHAKNKEIAELKKLVPSTNGSSKAEPVATANLVVIDKDKK